MKIGNITLDSNLILAPMAGVTDKAFRNITKPFGVGLMYTEMVSGKGLMYKNKKTERLLSVNEEEGIVAAQLFGHDPAVLSETALKAQEGGAHIIDINMGCPAPKIVNNGDGSALMKNPTLAGEIISEVKSKITVPLTVKFRMGWDENSINAVEFAKIAENSGADAITIHGRTRKQFYSGKANLDIIKNVKNTVNIPVIGNGDIIDGKSAKHMLDFTKCDGIMIGRGAQGNPWIFSEVSHYLKTGEALPPPTLKERLDKMLEHLDLLILYKGEHIGVLEARKHMAWYLRGLRGGAVFRDTINKASTPEEMRKIIFDIEQRVNL